jgi:hypothetical protein
MLTRRLFARLEAQPGKEGAVAAFLMRIEVLGAKVARS